MPIPINTELMHIPFEKLQQMGASNINEIPYEELLFSLRHNLFIAAKDLVAKPDRDWNDREIGIVFCEAAESIHQALEVLGFEE